jgi:hypothetical protein
MTLYTQRTGRGCGAANWPPCPIARLATPSAASCLRPLSTTSLRSRPAGRCIRASTSSCPCVRPATTARRGALSKVACHSPGDRPFRRGCSSSPLTSVLCPGRRPAEPGWTDGLAGPARATHCRPQPAPVWQRWPSRARSGAGGNLLATRALVVRNQLGVAPRTSPFRFCPLQADLAPARHDAGALSFLTAALPISVYDKSDERLCNISIAEPQCCRE